MGKKTYSCVWVSAHEKNKTSQLTVMQEFSVEESIIEGKTSGKDFRRPRNSVIYKNSFIMISISSCATADSVVLEEYAITQ